MRSIEIAQATQPQIERLADSIIGFFVLVLMALGSYIVRVLNAMRSDQKQQYRKQDTRWEIRSEREQIQGNDPSDGRQRVPDEQPLDDELAKHTGAI